MQATLKIKYKCKLKTYIKLEMWLNKASPAHAYRKYATQGNKITVYSITIDRHALT